jgi:hypothetical protein
MKIIEYIIITGHKLFFYAVAINIQAILLACDEFLCVFVIDFSCQSI